MKKEKIVVKINKSSTKHGVITFMAIALGLLTISISIVGLILFVIL